MRAYLAPFIALFVYTGAAGAEEPPKLAVIPSLTLNFTPEEEVDEAFHRAERAGARVLKRPEPVSWGGYSGYFADPDGHHWEVAWNPFWPVRADGRIDLPKD